VSGGETALRRENHGVTPTPASEQTVRTGGHSAVSDVTLPGFTARTLSERDRRLLDRREHVLVGLSPFNGYYTPHLIRRLLTWCHARFERVDALIPGYEAAHTLTSAGLEPREAVHRARRAVSQLRNPAVGALRDCGAAEPGGSVHTWTTLANRPAYARLHEQVRRDYAHDPVIRFACRETARAAVRTHMAEEPSERQVDGAVSYPLAELPLLLDSPAIFGVGSSVFVYHRELGPFTPVFEGRSHCARPSPGQGYAVLTPDPPAAGTGARP
jgi:cyclo(L-tyrosyl-L-tyrosyl) synthase